MIITIVLWLFILLETLNVLILYFNPTSKKGNGVAVFDTYNELQENDMTKLFTTYLVNWVAGTKIIFIALLVVINIFGTDFIKLTSTIVLVPAIGTYYFKLHPIIKKMDEEGKITPKGYSKTLGVMITCFIGVFICAIIAQVVV